MHREGGGYFTCQQYFIVNFAVGASVKAANDIYTALALLLSLSKLNSNEKLDDNGDIELYNSNYLPAYISLLLFAVGLSVTLKLKA